MLYRKPASRNLRPTGRMPLLPLFMQTLLRCQPQRGSLVAPSCRFLACSQPPASQNDKAETTSSPGSRKSAKPPQDHVSNVPTPSEVMLQPIGYVRSPYKERFGTPRQATVQTNIFGGAAAHAEIMRLFCMAIRSLALLELTFPLLAHMIHLVEGLNLEQALSGLEQFDYIWIVSYMHLNKGWKPMVTPTRGPRKKRGVFSTRSPHRPNQIALTAAKLVSVRGRVLTVHGIDLLDRTPVLDIKPYVPYCDSFPGAKAGWLDELQEDMEAPDRLEYYPPPARLLPLSPSEPGASLTDGSQQ
mmetsp:Transcript_38246/g.61964  ORF Transcript_38246/g.61964 Transcript_38246/m.61964 type:complete len:300 (+) Transcript_38246:1716-2615(+)